MTSASADALDLDGGSAHSQRIFLGCFFSIFATASAFIVRALVITEWGTTFNLTEAQKGAIFPGAALFPFAISIVLFSLFIDRLGYGKTMAFAFIGHFVGTIITISATKAGSATAAYQLLYFGTLITSFANGAVEAVANPVTATLFPRNKTHYLNILHAGWPGGLVAMGVVTLLMGTSVSWEWKVGLVLLPTLLYGVLLLGQKFPVQERVAAGVSYTEMMREFGAASAFILAWFLVMATLTVIAVSAPGVTQNSAWDGINNWSPPIIAAICAIAFFAAYRSLGRPLFIFLLLVMLLLATTELGVDGWVTDLMTPAFKQHAGWILVYTSAIMFVLRFFAGPIVHRISPLGLLAVCAAVAAVALFVLANVGTSVGLVMIAATLYGIGKSFFWPTTLGVVAEQFPKGGALTLSAMGGMGMIGVGVLGGPFCGALLDVRMDRQLAQQAPAIHALVVDGETRAYGMQYKKIDQAKVAALPKEQAEQFTQIQGETKQGALATIAILPAIMLVCYLAMIAYFRSKGGYAIEELTMSGEKASGGIQAPVEA